MWINSHSYLACFVQSITEPQRSNESLERTPYALLCSDFNFEILRFFTRQWFCASTVPFLFRFCPQYCKSPFSKNRLNSKTTFKIFPVLLLCNNCQPSNTTTTVFTKQFYFCSTTDSAQEESNVFVRPFSSCQNPPDSREHLSP